MLNEDVIKGKWREVKGEIQKAWGKLTNDELEQTKGDLKAISGLVQQRYGESKEQFEKKMSDVMSRFDYEKDKLTDDVKDSLKH